MAHTKTKKVDKTKLTANRMVSFSNNTKSPQMALMSRLRPPAVKVKNRRKFHRREKAAKPYLDVLSQLGCCYQCKEVGHWANMCPHQ